MSKRARPSSDEKNVNKYEGNLPEVVEKSKFVGEYRALCGELAELLCGDTQHAITFRPALAQIMLEDGTLKILVCFMYPSAAPIRLHALSDCIATMDIEYKPFIHFADGMLTVECHRPHQ